MKGESTDFNGVFYKQKNLTLPKSTERLNLKRKKELKNSFLNENFKKIKWKIKKNNTFPPCFVGEFIFFVLVFVCEKTKRKK